MTSGSPACSGRGRRRSRWCSRRSTRRGTSTRRSPRSAAPAPCSARPTSTTSRSRRRSAGRARSSTCGCAAPTYDDAELDAGRRASSRSSTTGSTRSSCSATTRTGRRALRAEAFAAASTGRSALAGPLTGLSPSREPSARPEGHDRAQLLGDVVEPVRDRRPRRRSCRPGRRRGLVAGREPAAAGDHDVDLVLGVRLLAVDGAGREDVQPDRQVRHAQELQVRAAAAGDEVGERERSMRSPSGRRADSGSAGTDRRGGLSDAELDRRRPAPGAGRLLRYAAVDVTSTRRSIALARRARRRVRHERPAPSASVGPSASPPASASPAATPSASASEGSPIASASAMPASIDPTGLRIVLEPVATGFDRPLFVINAGDGSGRLFVVEQGGRIRIVQDGDAPPAPFLDISDRISSGGERGLLGLAFHPGFPADPRLFVDYTDVERRHAGLVVHGRARPTPDRARPRHPSGRSSTSSSPTRTTTAARSRSSRTASCYIALGDGGSGGDPQGTARTARTLLGQDPPDRRRRGPATSAYAIPARQPVRRRQPSGAPEIWLTGLRNPWRLQLRPGDGRPLDRRRRPGRLGGDRRQRGRAAGRSTSAGTGWRGRHCFQPPGGCDDERPDDARHRVRATTRAAPSSAATSYRGTAQPALIGGYLFADYCSGTDLGDRSVDRRYRDPTVVAETGHTIAARSARTRPASSISPTLGGGEHPAARARRLTRGAGRSRAHGRCAELSRGSAPRPLDRRR